MDDPDPDEACLDMLGSSRIAATARARISGSLLGVEGGVGKRLGLNDRNSGVRIPDSCALVGEPERE